MNITPDAPLPENKYGSAHKIRKNNGPHPIPKPAIYKKSCSTALDPMVVREILQRSNQRPEPTFPEHMITEAELNEIKARLYKWAQEGGETIGKSSEQLTTERAFRDVAVGKILGALINKSSSLDLSLLYLTELPPEIGLLTHLKKLDLGFNYISTFPPGLLKLVNLREINFRQNRLLAVPPGIENLSHLEVLNLSSNRLSVLPPEMRNIKTLRWINTHDNDPSRE